MPDAIRRDRIVKQIGSGGMGVVHAAHDSQLDGQIAIKTISVQARLEARSQVPGWFAGVEPTRLVAFEREPARRPSHRRASRAVCRGILNVPARVVVTVAVCHDGPSPASPQPVERAARDGR